VRSFGPLAAASAGAPRIGTQWHRVAQKPPFRELPYTVPLPGHGHRPGPDPLRRSLGAVAGPHPLLRDRCVTGRPQAAPPSDLVPDSADAESQNSSQNGLELAGETRLTVQGG